jgi:hypothetical protein
MEFKLVGRLAAQVEIDPAEFAREEGRDGISTKIEKCRSNIGS